MNDTIMEVMGFGKEVKLRKEGKCPLCERNMMFETFRDNISRKEFAISGLCQKCQDEVFEG